MKPTLSPHDPKNAWYAPVLDAIRLTCEAAGPVEEMSLKILCPYADAAIVCNIKWELNRSSKSSTSPSALNQDFPRVQMFEFPAEDDEER